MILRILNKIPVKFLLQRRWIPTVPIWKPNFLKYDVNTNTYATFIFDAVLKNLFCGTTKEYNYKSCRIFQTHVCHTAA